ncbi:MAG: hypothetical protein HWD85_11515 [Flavobacteriaceae bacterium]|nr:hypothetical protein [Flavobacteriaceae bacterium]
MKKLIIFICVVAFTANSSAQSEKYLEKVKTLDSTIKTLYEVISGPKGEARNWELFNYLFKPEAKLIPTGTNKQGIHIARYMTTKQYINISGKWVTDTGFFEKETARSVHKFGNIAQVFSTYEAYNHNNKTTPFMKGINSIQLLYDNNRWWIINIYWQQASKKHPIPKEFLPKQ